MAERQPLTGSDKAFNHMLFSRQRNGAFITRIPLFAIFPAVLVGGCATLPSSGPTGAQIQKGAQASQGVEPIKIVELTNIAALPSSPAPPAIFRNDFDAAPTDLVGPGDVLDTTIYETGTTLFAGDGKSPAGGVSFAPAAQAERLPPQRIDDNGEIRIPYIGKLRVAGLTVAQIEASVRAAMRGLSQNPQVSVSIRDDITNTVIIAGEIGRPGRLVLSTNRETVGDAIALSGGYRGDAKDLSVMLQRQDVSAEYRLADILNGAQRDLRIRPGDKIAIIRSPRTFSVLGAPGRVEQIPFSGPSISLTEALAQSAGVNPNAGDPRAVFVFRFVHGDDGKDIPVVYHLNMMNTGAYFLSQRFVMRDKDVLYIGNAGANQPSKLVQIISQLFAPIVTVTSAVSVLHN
jgi:polysaccharide export outer membrane protein